MANQMTMKERKEWAKTIYLSEPGINNKTLANRVGTSPNTVGKWINEGNWEKLRRNMLLTREEQMQNLLLELEEFNAHIKSKKEGKRFADSKEADTRRKLIKDIKDLETKTGIAEMVSVCTRLVDWVTKMDLAKGKELAELCDGFIKNNLR